MAKRLSVHSKHVQIKIVGPVASFAASRIQRFSTNADQPTNTIDELGNPNHAGTSRDIPNVTITFQAMDVGIKVISVLTGQDENSFPAAGVNIATGDSAMKEIDIVGYVKSETASDYVKSLHLRRCRIQSFTFNYTVDGDSTEEYTAVGSAKRWFTTDVMVELFSSGAGPFALGETEIVLKNGDSALSVIKDGVYLEEVSVAPAVGEYRITGSAVNLNAGDPVATQMLVVYQASPAGNNWADINELDAIPAAIRGKDVSVSVGGTAQVRVQAVSVTANFNPQAIREMGRRDVVGYREQIPEVTGTITVLDTDTELIEFFTVGEFDGGDTEFVIGGCSVSGAALELQLLDPSDCEDPITVLKTVYLDEIVITSEGFTSNVNDNATQTFDYRSETGSVVVYSGARP
ncbi:hypothetical protein LCGC14_0482900 [marine sediment metagenome]|uniref:Uncharacterized protein n=1 Tax=marine sediment metagenome TaxID=412755 RepID=A0A0F9SS15_9ZZZZ|nr:hypothetical protein [bacterium]